MKLIGVKSGPYETVDGQVWCLYSVTDGDNYWTEEVYYEDMDECMEDVDEVYTEGFKEVGDED